MINRIFFICITVLILTNCGGSDGIGEIAGNVNDNQNPSVTTLTVSPNNAGGNSTSSIGDEVILEVVADESILAPTVLFNNNAADLVSGSGQNWMATYTLRASDVSGATSTVNISAAVVDLQGNAGQVVTQTTDGSQIIVDQVINSTVMINVNKSPVAGSSCNVTDQSGTSLGQANTDANGMAQVNVQTVGEVFVTVTCTGGSYMDEATGEMVMADNLVLRSAMLVEFEDVNAPELPLVVVTPLTEIAFNLAMQDNDITDFTQQAIAVGQSSGVGAVDVASILPTNSLVEEIDETTTQDLYGAVLAGISQAVATNATNTSTTDTVGVLQQFITDLSTDIGVAGGADTAISQLAQGIIDIANSDSTSGGNIDTQTIAIITPEGPEGLPSDNVDIFIDDIDPLWDQGIQAFSADTNFSENCVNGGENCPSIAWEITAAADTARGQIIQISHATDGQFSGAFIAASSPVDLSGFANGSIRFDINVTEAGTGNDGTFDVQVDCGNGCSSGRFSLLESEGFVAGATGWQTVTVPVNRITGGEGRPFVPPMRLGVANLSMISAGIVLFPTEGQQSGVVFQLDNVFWEPSALATDGNGDGDAGDIPTGAVLPVFEDAVDTQWDLGVQAFSADTGFAENCVNGGENCSSIAWEVIAAADTARGQVLQISHTTDGQFSGAFISATTPIDLSGFASGSIQFDINVTEAGTGNDGTFDVQVDCGAGCGSGRFSLLASEGFVAGATGWQSVTVPISRITGGEGRPFVPSTRLAVANLTMVTTGLVVFPTEGQQSGVVFQIDNARWEVVGEATSEPAPTPVSPVTTDGTVFDDAIDERWDIGIRAFSADTGFFRRLCR